MHTLIQIQLYCGIAFYQFARKYRQLKNDSGAVSHMFTTPYLQYKYCSLSLKGLLKIYMFQVNSMITSLPCGVKLWKTGIIIKVSKRGLHQLNDHCPERYDYIMLAFKNLSLLPSFLGCFHFQAGKGTLTMAAAARDWGAGVVIPSLHCPLLFLLSPSYPHPYSTPLHTHTHTPIHTHLLPF